MRLMTRGKTTDDLREEANLNAKKMRMYRLAEQLQTQARELEAKAEELKREIIDD